MVPRPESAGRAGLPAPDFDALAHSRRLCELLRCEIERAGGRISFRRYMDMVLHEPGLGYYSAGAVKFGAAGDFITAPEISSLFSHCVARQCAEILVECGGSILELGAGTGIMAADILAELDVLDALPERYLILETSAELRQRQAQILKQRVPRHVDRVRWLDALPPRGAYKGVILGNEVVDALPVHRVVVEGDRIAELGVCLSRGGFDWAPETADTPMQRQVESVFRDLPEQPPPGYVTEINTSLGPWVAALAEILERGALLCLDYGYPRLEYYHPQRTGGTLRCYYRHRVHDDPFLYPGLQDITACVDFSALAEAGAAAGLELYGFTTQAQFLVGCGLETLLGGIEAVDERTRLELAGQIRKLTLPGEMGERIKVICMGRGLSGPLSGFSPVDHRHRL